MPKLTIVLSLVFLGIWNMGVIEAANVPEIKVLQDRGSSITIEFELQGYEIEPVDINGNVYSRVTLPGQVTFLEKGLPELPTIARNVIIPDDGLMDYRIVSIEYKTQKVAPVIPSKGNLYRNVNPEDIPYRFDKFYQTDSWWPAQTIEIYEPFIVRDYRGVTVRFNPFQYNPVQNELKVAQSVVIELYETGKGGDNVIEERKHAITHEFVDIYENIFLNFGNTRYDSVAEQAGRMVIIAADAYVSNMEDFKVWKRMKGIETKMVPISSIGNNEANIKNFIQSEYDAGDLIWVLLVGDGNEVVPATGTVGDASGAAADPVYAYTAGSDYYPDIFVSRFSSRAGNSINIDKQASRSIEYERTPETGADWYHVGLGVASAQGSPADSTRCNWLRDSLLNYYYTEVNKSYDYWGTSSLIKGFIEAGTGIINYIGHGNTSGWGNGGGFNTSHINNLDNPWMLPFVISVACLVGNFNGPDCYCEASVTAGTVDQPDGFLVHWGSSINQSWVPPCIGQEGAVNLLTHDKKNSAGGIFFNGACYMIEYYGGGTAGVEMAQTWLIFGDASLQLRTNTPATITVNHTPSISVGQTAFDVSVPGVESALVGLYIDTLLVGHGYTDAAGEVTIILDPPPDETGTMYITVTAYNKIPYLGSVPIVSGDDCPPSAPHVTQTEKSGNGDVILTWNAVTTDTLGASDTIDCYVVYRGTSASFVPGISDSIGLCTHPDTTYTDTDVLNGPQSYYYLVKAVDNGGNKSTKSNMSYVFHKAVNENSDATDKNLASLPYDNGYSTVSDITDDLSPSGDPLIKITNLRDDQLYESWTYSTTPPRRWTGTDFSIIPGRAYEMVTIKDTSIVFVGCNDPDGLVSLNENLDAPDKNWVSIPYNAVYGTASDITDEYSPAGDPLIKITNLRDDQLYESWSYTAVPTPRWTGTNFAITPGRGYELVVITDTTWNPTEHSNDTSREPREKAFSRMNAGVHVGTSTEPHRSQLWLTDDGNYVQTTREVNNDYREVGISHLVRGYFELTGCEDIVFTVYRPRRPNDVLTENMIGSGYTIDDEFGLFWFDVGNFRYPWQADDEVILIIGASQNGTWYFTDVNFKLNEKLDVQELGNLSLVAASQGPQSTPDTHMPVDYAFTIYPNPFMRQTRMDYALPTRAAVKIAIYDVSGRQIKTLASGVHNPGYYSFVWDGADDTGRKVSAGVYFASFKTDNYEKIEKALLLR